MIEATHHDRVLYLNKDTFGNQGDGVHLIPFWAEKLNGKLYDGIEIAVLIDPRDAFKGHWSLEFDKSKPGNSFIMTQPLLSATFLDTGDTREYEKIEDSMKVKEGHNTMRIAYQKQKVEQQRVKIKMIITDEDGDGLYSDVPLGCLQDSRKLQAKIVPYICGSGMMGQHQEINTLFTRMTWKVVNMQTEREVETTKKADEMEEFANVFKGLGV